MLTTTSREARKVARLGPHLQGGAAGEKGCDLRTHAGRRRDCHRAMPRGRNAAGPSADQSSLLLMGRGLWTDQ
eukprot:5418215-Pyramimonas_sp.AAC.1